MTTCRSARTDVYGKPLVRADREYFWAPRPGAHLLRLLGEGGREFDRLEFSARRPAPGASAKSAAP
jgi:hypothetical protein